MLLDSAVRAVNGNIRNKDALRAELRKANFRSTRGKFRFNNNQFPIQDFYVAKVVKEGNSYVHQVTATAFKDHTDRFASACKMK